jgi:hypothetical protein
MPDPMREHLLQYLLLDLHLCHLSHLVHRHVLRDHHHVQKMQIAKAHRKREQFLPLAILSSHFFAPFPAPFWFSLVQL